MTPVIAPNRRWYEQWLRHHLLSPRLYCYIGQDLPAGFRGEFIEVGRVHRYARRVKESD